MTAEAAVGEQRPDLAGEVDLPGGRGWDGPGRAHLVGPIRVGAVWAIATRLANVTPAMAAPTLSCATITSA